MKHKILACMTSISILCGCSTVCLDSAKADTIGYWKIGQITVKPLEGESEDLILPVTIQGAIDSYGLSGTIELPEATRALLNYPYGEDNAVWSGDVYGDGSNFMSNSSNVREDGRLYFGYVSGELMSPSGTQLVKLVISIPDEDTVHSIAKTYDIPIQMDEDDTLYYEFPVNWAEYGTDTSTSYSRGQEVSVELSRFSYSDDTNQDIFQNYVELENGSIRVEVTHKPVTFIKGDSDGNGLIEIADAYNILKYYASHAAGDTTYTFQDDPSLESDIVSAVDINSNLVINIMDASLVLKYYALHAAGNDVTWDDIL